MDGGGEQNALFLRWFGASGSGGLLHLAKKNPVKSLTGTKQKTNTMNKHYLGFSHF